MTMKETDTLASQSINEKQMIIMLFCELVFFSLFWWVRKLNPANKTHAYPT